MINFLSKWIEGIAITVIIASIFEMLIPNGNIKKYIKAILGIYVIFSIIAPFVDSKALYSFDLSKTIEGYSKNITNEQTQVNQIEQNKDLEKIYKETFEKEIKQAVEKQGYNVYKCEVEGNFNAEENAAIKKIKIVIESKKAKEVDSNENEEFQNSNLIENIKEIENVEISIGNKINNNENSEEVTLKDISNLIKYLSEHYELDKKIIDIQIR